jgi:hypothetical protein
MQSAADLRYSVEPGEERIGEKRALGYRSMAQRLEARRDRKVRKSKRRCQRDHKALRTFKEGD